MKRLLICIALTLIVVCGLLPGCYADKPVYYSITVLHTNDTHAHLDEIARYAGKVKEIREARGIDNIMLLHAGDVFAGTPYYMLYHGLADLWFMNYLKYDAMCLGNHEFDNGPDVLAKFIAGAEFPVLCANFDFSKVNALSGKVNPYIIIERGGASYGIFGLTTEETKEISRPGPDIAINDHIAAAREAVAYFQRMKINKIIALTHLGWDVDLALAKEVEGIDLIVGGHSHTVPAVYPTMVTSDNTPTLVVQSGCFDSYLGQLNLVFDNNGIIRSWDDSQLIAINEKLIADEVCTAKLAEYKEPLQQYVSRIIGKTLVDLDGDKEHVRTGETNLGNLVADAMLNKASCVNAGLAIVNSGGIRSSIKTGDISLWQVMEVLPFNNYLECTDLSGEQIVAALENGVSQAEQSAGRFPQVAGLRFWWDPSASPGKRIQKVEVVSSGIDYKRIELTRVYRVATNDYMIEGGDGYASMQGGVNTTNLGFMLFDVLAEYIELHGSVDPMGEDRINRVETKSSK